MRYAAALSFLLMTAFSSPALSSPEIGEEACRKETYLETDYVICTFDPAKSDIRIYKQEQRRSALSKLCVAGR